MPRRLETALVAAIALGTIAAGMSIRAQPNDSTRTRAPAPAPETPAEPTPDRAAPAGPFVGAHGSTLIQDQHGLLVVEADPGVLVRATRDNGAPIASLKLSPGAAQVVHDGKGMVFVSDRQAHRVVRVAAGDAEGKGLAELAAATVREPFGLALTPDGKTLLVTSVADHRLVALSTERLEQRWSIELAPEPRPVAVSADGRHAAVGFLSLGAVAIIDLTSHEHTVRWQPLDPADHVDVEVDESEDFMYEKHRTDSRVEIRLIERRSRFRVPVETGRRYARNVRALAFDGAGSLFVAHQVAAPQIERVPSHGRGDIYGGGEAEVRPIEHWVSVIERPGELDAHRVHTTMGPSQAFALTVAPGDASGVFVGGLDDAVQRLTVSPDDQFDAHSPASPPTEPRCGLDGLIVDGDGLWGHCRFTRTLVRLPTYALGDHPGTPGPELAPSARTDLVRAGEQLFHSRRWEISGSGLSCAGCHPDGRSDQLSWRLGPEILQTPILAGRVQGTAPYKWAGSDANLEASFRHTLERIGGSPEHLDEADYAALVAYVESLDGPMAPAPAKPEAAARGRAVFEDEACDTCHSGPSFTDASQHELQTRLARVDTPSLLGLAHSAPFFHDGSAQDLWALVTDKGSVHDMADLSRLSVSQRHDLVAYLEGL